MHRTERDPSLPKEPEHVSTEHLDAELARTTLQQLFSGYKGNAEEIDKLTYEQLEPIAHVLDRVREVQPFGILKEFFSYRAIKRLAGLTEEHFSLLKQIRGTVPEFVLEQFIWHPEALSAFRPTDPRLPIVKPLLAIEKIASVAL